MRKLALLLTCAVPTAICGYWSGSSLSDSPGAGHMLIVDPEYRDLGKVWAQQAFRYQVQVHNPTDHRVAAKSLAASCACTSIEPPGFSVPARGSIPLKMVLRLDGLPEDDTLAWERDFAVTVRPEFADNPTADEEWVFTARVLRPYLLVKAPDFGDSLVAGTDFPAQSFLLAVHPSLVRLTVKQSHTKHGSVVLHRTSDHGTEYCATYYADKRLRPGLHNDELALVGTDRHGRQFALEPLRFRVPVCADLHVLPSALSFGTIEVGKTARGSVEIKSRTGRPFVIASNGTVLADNKLAARIGDSCPAAPAPSQTVRVDITPACTGIYTRELLLAVAYDASPLRERVPVLITYSAEEQKQPDVRR